jgi:hypothetical protein
MCSGSEIYRISKHTFKRQKVCLVLGKRFKSEEKKGRKSFQRLQRNFNSGCNGLKKGFGSRLVKKLALNTGSTQGNRYLLQGMKHCMPRQKKSIWNFIGKNTTGMAKRDDLYYST